jgi:hypothetical protein
MGPLRARPTIANRGVDAHALLESEARRLAHAQLVTCNCYCAAKLWTAGRVSAYPAVQSFRLILRGGLQGECGGTAHQDRIVWELILSISLAD